MRTFKTALNGKGLLTASIAMLSGHALAETAGRVTFVTGDVGVTAADGSQRLIRRGEAINGGDRISTRGGRVQIRFTDGGFVSLQPNTVFGVDEYLYTNRKPEETSLFFSLVQGGMRTITGAIGKVNKKSYQVRTPVATIGIRGTEYQAVVLPDGLKVSVGAGFVNVSNQGGEITGGARQVIRVTRPDASPELTDEDIELLATRADGGERRNAGEEEEETGTSNRTVTIADVQNGRGDYLYLFTTQDALPDSVYPEGPTYRLGGPSTNSSPYSPSLYANFDTDGTATGSVGGLTKLYDPYTISGCVVENLVFDSGTLKVVNSGTIGVLSWGEFTDGISGVNQVFDSCNDGCFDAFELGSDQHLSYIIGQPSTQLLTKGFGTYTLQGGTPARDRISGAEGRLDYFQLRVNFGLGSVDAALKVSLPTNSYTVTTASSGSLYGASDMPTLLSVSPGGSYGFSLDSYNLQVTDSNGNCSSGSSGCFAAIDGFFAGPGGVQVGTSYSISDYVGGADITGTAALGLGTVSTNAPYLPDSSSGTYYELRYGLPGLGGWPDTTHDVRFDKDGSVTGTVGGLASINGYDWVSTVSGGYSTYTKIFDSGSLSVTNSGTIGALSWGEFTDGASGVNQVFDSCGDGCTYPFALNSDEYLPYIIGASMSGRVATSKGTATYSLQGKTPARDQLGRTGTLNSFNIKLNLDFNSVQAALQVSMPGARLPADTASGFIDVAANVYTVQTTGPVALVDLPVVSGFSLSSGQLSVTDSSGACASSFGGCYASIDAFFTGKNHEQIGAAYEVNDYNGPYSSEITGVAALGLSGTSTDTVLASGPHYTAAFASPTSPGVDGGFGDNGLTVNFDALQGLTTATRSSSDLSLDRQTAQVTDVGQVGALKWGRWYGNASDVNGTTVTIGGSDTALGSNQSLHYIVGPMTQPEVFQNILNTYGSGASATYTYQNGTKATGSDGALGAVTAGSTLTMTFGYAPTLDMDIGVDMQTGNDYQITGSAYLSLSGSASQFSAYNGSGSSCAVVGSGSCGATVQGFFAGQQAQQIGLGYVINDSGAGRTVNGAAAFGRGDITATPLLPQ